MGCERSATAGVARAEDEAGGPTTRASASIVHRPSDPSSGEGIGGVVDNAVVDARETRRARREGRAAHRRRRARVLETPSRPRDARWEGGSRVARRPARARPGRARKQTLALDASTSRPSPRGIDGRRAGTENDARGERRRTSARAANGDLRARDGRAGGQRERDGRHVPRASSSDARRALAASVTDGDSRECVTLEAVGRNEASRALQNRARRSHHATVARRARAR